MYKLLEGNPAVQLPEYTKSNTADTARAVAPVTASANRGVATAASPLAGTSGCFFWVKVLLEPGCRSYPQDPVSSCWLPPERC